MQGPPIEVRMYQVRTRDRWLLALHRYRVLSAATARRLPIVLCHGLGSNRFSFDVPQGPSLARYLATRGYDVWSVELRGAGNSSRPRLFNDLRWEWTFQHYVRFDAPAALSYVCEVAGVEQAHWIGHSLGGMVGYALLADHEPPIASLVAIASPTVQIHPAPPVPGAKVIKALLTRFSRVPSSLTARLGSPLTGMAFRLSLFKILYNPENMEPAVIRRLLGCALDDVPSRLLLDCLLAFESRRDGKRSEVFAYEHRLDRIEVPLLLVGGVRDGLCRAQDLEAVLERVSSPIKEMRLLGRESGCQHDYGHHDLLLGKNSHLEVFRPISDWLDARDGDGANLLT